MKKDQILIIMPTRERPWAALTAIASVMRNADQPERVCIRICQDLDDELLFNFSGATQNVNISTVVRSRMGFLKHVNETIKEALEFIELFSHVAWLGDDVRYDTKGWDTIVRCRPELVVYGRDEYQNAMKATHPFVRREIIQALGFIAPRELNHYYPDDFVGELGKALGSIVYDPSIITEHFHPDADESIPLDFTYKEARLSYWEKDRETYEKTIEPNIAGYAARVKAYVAEKTRI